MDRDTILYNGRREDGGRVDGYRQGAEVSLAVLPAEQKSEKRVVVHQVLIKASGICRSNGSSFWLASTSHRERGLESLSSHGDLLPQSQDSATVPCSLEQRKLPIRSHLDLVPMFVLQRVTARRPSSRRPSPVRTRPIVASFHDVVRRCYLNT